MSCDKENLVDYERNSKMVGVALDNDILIEALMRIGFIAEMRIHRNGEMASNAFVNSLLNIVDSMSKDALQKIERLQ